MLKESFGDRGKVCTFNNGFPAGVRVLVVDDDQTCLTILATTLQVCDYAVTPCQRAEDALSMLRESKSRFDIILIDVHMPDMDGFKLLDIIGFEMDLPAVMMSSDDREDIVKKSIIHGACDFLVKPIRREALKYIWIHVFRKMKNSKKKFEHFSRDSENSHQHYYNDGGHTTSLIRKRGDEDEVVDAPTVKKPRLIWTAELHQKFVTAVNELGQETAVPKKILERMATMDDVPGLTRENVASHLQKYRLYLRRLREGPKYHSGNVTSIVDPNESNSLDGCNAYARVNPSQQILLQSCTIPIKDGAESNANSSIGRHFVDNSMNPFGSSLQEPKYRTRQQYYSGNSSINHGIPTAIELKQPVVLLPQPVQMFPNNNFQASGSNPSFLHFPGSVEDYGNQNNTSIMQMAQISHSPQPLSMQILTKEIEDMDAPETNSGRFYPNTDLPRHSFFGQNNLYGNVSSTGNPSLQEEEYEYRNLVNANSILVDDAYYKMKIAGTTVGPSYDQPLMYFKHFDQDDILP